MDVESLFNQYANHVYRLALSYTRSSAEAEDVCQTVFLKLMEQKHIQPGKEKSWLMQVTVNECRSLLRSSWWKKTAALDESLHIGPPEINHVFQAIMQLCPQERAAIYLHYYEGYTAREIGKLLKLSQTAVTTRLHRARQRLKELLKED